MEVQRCPECGGRLQTNYCDICLRKVPFKGVPAKQTWQHVDGSSAHREENHECISFDDAERKLRKTRRLPKQKQPVKDSKKTATIVAIVLAAMSVVSSLFGLVEGLMEEGPHMEYNQEAYITEADVPAITATEIYNDGGIVITADSSGLYYDEYAIAMTIENGSDRDIDVMIEKVTVNGYMMDYGMSAEVTAGASCQPFLQLYDYELEKANITQIARIDMQLYIYDRDSYDEIAFVDMLTLETQIADTYTQRVDNSGWEMYNDGGVSIRLRDISMLDYGDCELDVHVENMSGKAATVYTDAIYVNGEQVDGTLWSVLLPDTYDVETGYISCLADLDITDISEITEICMEFCAEYSDDGEIVETVTGTALFNPNALPVSE